MNVVRKMDRLAIVTPDETAQEVRAEFIASSHAIKKAPVKVLFYILIPDDYAT